MVSRNVYERVDDDLAQGHTHVAVQRLSSLVSAQPTNLEARLRLARVHLATGNLVEAGRWGFLTEEADADAITAFERAQRDAGARRSDLRWSGEDSALGPLAQERLAALDAAVADAQERRPFRTENNRIDLGAAGCAFAAAALALVLVVCVVAGAITVVDALF